MARLVLQLLSDFGDFSGSKELTEILSGTEPGLFKVRLSPDGRHLHVILHQPDHRLLTFDRYERPQLLQSPSKQDLRLSGPVPIVDVLYLDPHNNNNSNKGSVLLSVVYENGKAEFWKFLECKPGWHHLHTSDLCNSPRARLLSVCVSSNLLIWCEERKASESCSTRTSFRYCVCRRDFELEEGVVSLGGVKIALHNNPKFTVISSGDCVHLIPDLKEKPLMCISKCFLSWSLRQDSFTVSSLCKNTPLKKLSAKESDFKKLVRDCLGYLSALEPPEMCSFAPTACGGLLLLLSTGWLCLLQKDGTLRQVYKLEEKHLEKYGDQTSMCLYQDTLAILMGRNLHLIDLNCGRELEKMVLKREGVLYPNRAEKWTPHLVSETGLHVLVNRESRDCNSKMRPSVFSTAEAVQPGALLLEAVFEEACKYYQQRSLSSTQLTVDTLKQGGRFQAPISLASMLRGYLSTAGRQKEAELSQNGGGVAGQDKLMGSLEPELRALVSLEEVKGTLVRGTVNDVQLMCESLVEKEVARLLSSSELDRESLLYLNSIFSLFPSQAWRAAQAALQLHYNKEEFLSSDASPDVWKTVLSPSSSCTAFTNGALKHSSSLKADCINYCKTRALSCSSSALPVFELLCQAVIRFQPSFLPSFLELSQQQQSSAGLGLSLVSSSWNFSGGRAGEGGENNVPLYKRALCTLSSLNVDRQQQQELEVELLLVSGRPNAILQALRILMGQQQWQRVTQVAQRFSKQSPLLNKEIFSTLLCEVAQHRDLDPYLELLWTLCPEDFTVTTILNLLLKHLPAPSPHPSFSSSSSSSSSLPMSACSSLSPAPFSEPPSSLLTVGLLKPLLRKVLQRETKPSQHYADILQSPSFPPPALPRQPTEHHNAVTDQRVASAPCNTNSPSPPPLSPPSPLPSETPEQTHTNLQRSRVVLPANAV